MEAFEARFVSVWGWNRRESQRQRLVSLSEDPPAAYFPESSDTSATEPGGRVFKDKE